MRKQAAIALIAAVVCAVGCKRSELDGFHSNWKKLQLSPLASSSYLKEAETSPCAWNVQPNRDRITIERVSIRSLQRPQESRIQFPGGTLVGEDRGEWGGNLSVLERANQTPHEILSKNVLQMLLMRDGVAVITGDLQTNQGSVWLYSNTGEHGWSLQKKADLHGYPRVIGKSGERILLGYGNAISIMENFSEHQIAALPLLEVRPNSIAQDAKGDIYVGMNAFVVRLVPDRNGYSQQWFTQRECLQVSPQNPR